LSISDKIVQALPRALLETHSMVSSLTMKPISFFFKDKCKAVRHDREGPLPELRSYSCQNLADHEAGKSAQTPESLRKSMEEGGREFEN